MRNVLFVLMLLLVGCKSKQVVTTALHETSNRDTKVSNQVLSNSSVINTSKINATDISDIVTEINVIEYDSIKFIPVKETKIRQSIKRNSGSVSEIKNESHEQETKKIIIDEHARNKKIETSTSKPFNTMLFLKFIVGVITGFLIADLVHNFPKRFQVIKKILGFK